MIPYACLVSNMLLFANMIAIIALALKYKLWIVYYVISYGVHVQNTIFLYLLFKKDDQLQ